MLCCDVMWYGVGRVCVLCCAVLNDTHSGQIQVLLLCCRCRCVDDYVVDGGVVDAFAHGVDDGVDDVCVDAEQVSHCASLKRTRAYIVHVPSIR